jgi:hypothetical protein
MKRSTLINDLVKIYDTRPEGCSSYHIIDMLIYAAEKRGMSPPNVRLDDLFPKSELREIEPTHWYGCWEPEDEEGTPNQEEKSLFKELTESEEVLDLEKAIKEMDLSKRCDGDEETSEQFEQHIKDACDSFQNMLESLDEEDKKSVNEWTWEETDEEE